MTQTFHEMAISDVLVAPFVAQTGIALILYLVLRPLFARLAVDRLFHHPPIARLGLFAAILAMVIVLS